MHTHTYTYIYSTIFDVDLYFTSNDIENVSETWHYNCKARVNDVWPWIPGAPYPSRESNEAVVVFVIFHSLSSSSVNFYQWNIVVFKLYDLYSMWHQRRVELLSRSKRISSELTGNNVRSVRTLSDVIGQNALCRPFWPITSLSVRKPLSLRYGVSS